MERGQVRRWAHHRGWYDFDRLLSVYEEHLGRLVDLEHGLKHRLDHLYVALEGGRLLLALYLVCGVGNLRLLCSYILA